MKTKDLEYYRLNADENYITTPISVLRYITELETINAKLVEENERLAKEQNQSDRMHDNLVDISKNKTIQIEQLQSELSALKDEKNNFVNLEHRYQAQISEQIDRVNKWMNDAERLQSELSAAKERVKELEGDECVHPFNSLDIDKKLLSHFCKKCGTFVYKPTNP